MPRRAFDYVCNLVKDEMMVRSSSYTFLDGTMLSLEDRVAIALRRLNSGGSLVSGDCGIFYWREPLDCLADNLEVH